MVKEFFQTVDKRLLAGLDKKKPILANSVRINMGKFPDLTDVDIAIIGLGENANHFRRAFYSLSSRFSGTIIADLGNIRNDAKDRKNLAYGLTEVLVSLHEQQIFCIVIGEEEDLSAACVRAFDKPIDYALVSPLYALEEGDALQQVISDNKPFHMSLMAAQAYLVTEDDIAALEPHFYDTLRLGDFRANPEDAEPMLREADIFSFNLSAIKTSEFRATVVPLPNGLYNDEACLLCRYAGISNKLNTSCFFGFRLDKNSATEAMQLAQMVWYVADGFDNRFNDHPQKDHPNFMVYKCHISRKQDIVFIKSLLTERWWMEIPSGSKSKGKKQNTIFIGCTPNDFDIARGGDIPEKWYKAVGKLM